MSKAKFTKPDDIFREILRKLRRSKNLTQAEVAARLGQPQSFVSKYETGERRLDFVETFLVCEALGIDVVQFAAKFAAQVGEARRRKAGNG